VGLAALAVATPLPALASTSAPLSVGATNVPYARIERVQHPAALLVTAADVARGYLELPEGIELGIRTNSPNGYVVDVGLVGDLVSRAELWEPDHAEAPGQSLQRATRGPLRETLQVGMRLFVARGSEPGLYPWPVRFSIEPDPALQ